jgi:hypothetical protein
MITDNNSFYLMTLKDFEQVSKKIDLFGLNDRPMLNIFRRYPPTCHDSNGVAYWFVPYSYRSGDELRLEDDFYKVMRWFLTNVIVGSLPDRSGSIILQGQNHWHLKDK